MANISNACSDALRAPISCDGYLKYVMTGDFYGPIGNGSNHDSFCNPTCGTSLSSYHTSVATACAKDPQPFQGLAATYWADSAKSTWTSLCIKNPSTSEHYTSAGEHCTSAGEHHTSAGEHHASTGEHRTRRSAPNTRWVFLISS